ncbi:MAG TPA: serine hydroxymethyltransferase [Bacilli bacterium]|jgi:glycine hydroxymethyltransferase|nr:serine hydroxymethyltransferase [Bacillota bacterium]OQC49636.1 MAG: Serine hydroxymethyltransferase [Tenericutes bacterium ADurb.Bin024]HOE53917.1 serine hydroxymethyltransferase [Bacilli bacterium]HOM32283.1 serine hydroxymethyltransferase [Bacilli bacterium]HOQ70568.1 serine hydroxymethyltransferase [Bacilli bacterium]
MEKLFELVALETKRQNEGLELIASENFTSKKVRALAGSVLTNKYAEGYPGRRYYGGCHYIDEIEGTAIELAKKLFNAKYANVQPHSGSSANMIAYASVLELGDSILTLSLDEGGHLTHGSPVNFSSKHYKVTHYGLKDDGTIDYEALREIALKLKPKLILAGFSAYPFIIDFARIGKIAKEVGAYFMVDMAHIAGLIAGGYHPSPFPYADIVTSTTHKTLRGPRGGIILTNSEEIIKKVNFTCFPGMQGGPLENIIGAKAQSFYEALQPEFKEYIKRVVENTKVASETLRALGAEASETETHLFLLNTKKSYGITGKDAEALLETIKITTNKNMLPKDDERPNTTSGLRLGFAAVTTRGLTKVNAAETARIIHEFLSKKITKEEAMIRVNKIVDTLQAIDSL